MFLTPKVSGFMFLLSCRGDDETWKQRIILKIWISTVDGLDLEQQNCVLVLLFGVLKEVSLDFSSVSFVIKFEKGEGNIDFICFFFPLDCFFFE